MELEIDFTIKTHYGEYHDFYTRNLHIFKSFARVFESFFKKEKYQDSEIKIDDDAKDNATIRFCSKKYQLSLVIDPADLNSASIVLTKINITQSIQIGKVVMDHSENIIFPNHHKVLLKDSYEFNNAVLNFFMAAITTKTNKKTTGC